MWIVTPDTVHIVGVVLVNVTVSLDDAVALTVKSGSPYVLNPSAPNVIVWFALPPMVSVPLPVAESVAEV